MGYRTPLNRGMKIMIEVTCNKCGRRIFREFEFYMRGVWICPECEKTIWIKDRQPHCLKCNVDMVTEYVGFWVCPICQGEIWLSESQPDGGWTNIKHRGFTLKELNAGQRVRY